jgi:broad specificity phosphatase PhoE
MKIGLVRHFKVDYKDYNPFYFPDEYDAAIKGYDEADVILKEIHLDGIDWEICFSSSFSRAIKTAEYIYKKKIIKTELLREVNLKAFTTKRIKLPSFVWHIGARISWSVNGKSQPETKEATEIRIRKIYAMIRNSEKENVLVVSHGFFMKCFASFLIREGYNGKIDPVPHNGKLYVFQKERDLNENKMFMGQQ